MRLRLLPILAMIAWPLAAPAAAPQDVTIQAERLNKKALEDYDNLEFDSARQTLLSVIGKLRDAGLDETPIAATTYVNLGTVYIAGFKDRNRGVQQFVNALKIDPQMRLDAERATPELQDAFDEAQKQAGARPKPPVSDGASVPARTLQHTPVDEARVGQKVQIRAQLGSGLPVQRIFLFYRTAGQEEYVSVPMEESGKEWSAEVPGEAMTGKALQYYLDARDGKGQPVIGSGTSSSPHIISLTSPTGVDHDNPLGNKGKPEKSRGWGRIYLRATLGTGLGIALRGNHTEVAYQQGPDGQLIQQNVGTTGMVSAPLHLSAELGVQVVKAFSISAVGRFQVYTGANADGSAQGGTRKATGAVAGLLRLRYRFEIGRLRPYIALEGGYGYIRHMLNITSSQSGAEKPLVDVNGTVPVCPNQEAQCIDTVAMGSILLGGGLGIWYDVTRFDNGGFGIIAELNVLAGFGDQTGVNFDLNLGIGAHFL